MYIACVGEGLPGLYILPTPHHLLFKNQKERDFSDSTISRRLSTIKQFFKFLIKEGLLDRNPCEDIKNFRKAKKIPGFLSEEEVLKILNSASSVGKNRLEKTRNKALIEILYASGMRVSELVSLRKSLFIGTPEINVAYSPIVNSV